MTLFEPKILGLIGPARDCEARCSHSIWTVKGREMSPTSAGDSCLSERTVWYEIPLLSKNVRATSALSAKFTFCGISPGKTGDAHGVEFRGDNSGQVAARVN